MTIAFVGYLFVIASEYIGFGKYLPIINALKLPLISSAILVLYALYLHKIHIVLTSRQGKLFIFFIFLTFSALFHGFVRSYALEPLQQQIGYFLLIVVGTALLDTMKKIYVFLGFFIFLHVLLALVNMNHLVQPERIAGFQAGYFMGDGNDFAWGLVSSLPFCLYLLTHAKNKFKLVLIPCICFYLVGIIGTQSRGATLALTASLLYYFFFIIKNKIGGIVLILLLVCSVFIFAPENYFSRMGSIQHYQEDSSAMNRLKAWGSAVEMAIDNPFLGVGAGSFNSAYGRQYRTEEDPHRWISTHSIYFNVLGEYGFTGLVVFLFIIWTNLQNNRLSALTRKTSLNDSLLDFQWPLFINMGIIGYATAGMFLTGVDYTHLYILTTLTLSTSNIIHREIVDSNYSKIITEESTDLLC